MSLLYSWLQLIVLDAPVSPLSSASLDAQTRVGRYGNFFQPAIGDIFTQVCSGSEFAELHELS